MTNEKSKFGIHVLWVVPYVLIVSAIDYVIDYYRKCKYNRRMKRILKRNPDINTLTKLAGISTPGRKIK